MIETLKTIILTIITIVLISILIIIGLVVYTEISQEDNTVTHMVTDGYKLIYEALEERQEESEQKKQEGNEDTLNNVLSLNDMIQQQEKNDNQSNDYSYYYYYEQLNGYSKIIYNELEKNKENIKTGKYKIDFGEQFSEILSQENGKDLLQDYYQSAVETYLYDNPEIFYLSPKKMYINIQTIKSRFTTKYEVFIDHGENENYLAEGYETKEQIEIAEQEIQKSVNQILSEVEGKSEYQKIKKIHDYLVENITYEETISKSNIYNIYGALVNKECVCEGYAKAFKYLLNQLGIENVIVIGKATNSTGRTENHAWSYVKLEGNWYAVDVTWDDPIVTGLGFVSKKAKYKYFLLGNKEISKDHVLNTRFTQDGQEYIYPILSEENYE